MGVGVGEEEEERAGGSTRTASRERGIGARFAEMVGGREETRKRKGKGKGRRKTGMAMRRIFRRCGACESFFRSCRGK